ncbi:N-acetyltransferase, partial [candidate division KSB3 bacterium]|nr:N-acetyltransferase [candidate division KSB3 bacterium]MBD3322996.1 N-acetyltransferase [candidate division KSB3 bacterium]
MNQDAVTYRREVITADVRHVRAILESSGFFSEAEVAVAEELVQERLAKGL